MNWIWPNTYFYIENRGGPFWLSLRMIIVKFTNKRSKTYGLADWKRALHDRNNKILTQYSHHSRFLVLSWQRQQVTGVWWLLTLCFYQWWSHITHQILYLFRKYIIFIIISFFLLHIIYDTINLYFICLCAYGWYLCRIIMQPNIFNIICLYRDNILYIHITILI